MCKDAVSKSLVLDHVSVTVALAEVTQSQNIHQLFIASLDTQNAER